MKADDVIIYDSESEKEMTNACEYSYPEGSFQVNIWHLFNLGILEGKGCPVEQVGAYSRYLMINNVIE